MNDLHLTAVLVGNRVNEGCRPSAVNDFAVRPKQRAGPSLPDCVCL